MGIVLVLQLIERQRARHIRFAPTPAVVRPLRNPTSAHAIGWAEINPCSGSSVPATIALSSAVDICRTDRGVLSRTSTIAARNFGT